MTAHDERQVFILRERLAQYRSGSLSIHALVNDLAALARALDDRTLGDGLDKHAFDLELINSDIIERRRTETTEDKAAIEDILANVESMLPATPSNPTPA